MKSLHWRPHTRHVRLFAVAIMALGVCASIAAAGEPLRTQIDRLIAFETPGYDALAAPVAPDDEFLRRIHLDLTGTIPTSAEARAFLDDGDPEKRQKLVERLLASPGYARHMERTFDVLLMQRLPQKHVPIPEWEAFLQKSFAENKPWDAIVRELLTNDGSDTANRGAARFYLDREGETNHITRDIGRLFLGVNLECAQCHDHPQIGDYRQEHYYGIAAFYVRSFVMTDKEKRVVFAEKADGEATFESVFEVRDKTSKGPKSSGMKLFEGLTISEPKFDKPADAYLVQPNDKDKTIRPVARFSRRQKFAEWVASAENRRFCRTTANRLWALLLGRGIVHPVDLDHNDNPPSHPLLLALLTEEAAARQLDLKSLIREIVLSKTYQRSSRRATGDGAAPTADRFAVAALKPLTPSQLAWALAQATGEIEVERAKLGDKATEPALSGAIAKHEPRYVRLFGGEPGKTNEAFEATTEQTLFLANDPEIIGLLARKEGNLVDRLLKLPESDPSAIADELYLSTLTRRPTPEETQETQAYLAGQTGDARIAAVRDLIWALIASAEFRFNH